MGSITNIDDFRAARPAPPAAAPPKAEDFAWADRLATWWWSTPGRFVACAMVLSVIMTGLGLAVLAVATIAGAL